MMNAKYPSTLEGMIEYVRKADVKDLKRIEGLLTAALRTDDAEEMSVLIQQARWHLGGLLVVKGAYDD